MARKKASRTRAKLKSGKGRPISAKPAEEVKKSSSSIIEDLLQEAESHINSFSFDAAKSCCEKILNVEPKNIKAMEMLAGICMDEGDIGQAESLYLQCTEISPDSGHEKYFSLGQINEGRRSLEFYEQGISVLGKMLENSENAVPGKDMSGTLQRELSNAYCSVADLYLTDLCDEDSAEDACRKAIEDAIEADPNNPEAYQCSASYQLVKENDEEAVSLMKKSLSLWLPQQKELCENPDSDPSCEASIPEYASRVKTGKLLIELSMFDEASEVLEGLLDENDRDYNVWYLLGLSNYIRGDIYRGNASFYLKKAKEVACKEGVECDDVLAHIEELLVDLKDVESDMEEDDADGDLPISSSEEEEEEEDSANYAEKNMEL